MSKELGLMTQKQKIMEAIQSCADRLDSYIENPVVFAESLPEILDNLRTANRWIEEEL